MRKLLVLMVSLGVIGVSVYVGARVVAERSGTAIAQGSEDLLPIVLEGCKNAASSVRSGSGEVTVHRWHWRESGETLETETVYKTTFDTPKLKVSSTTYYLKNEFAQPDPELQRIEPGRVERSVLAYDAERVTLYLPDRQRAIIGDASSSVGVELRKYKAWVSFPDLITVSISEPTSTPEHTRSAPRVVGRQTLDGEDCIIVEIVDTRNSPDGEQTKHTTWNWVSPDKGYTVPKSQAWAEGGVFKKKTLLAEMQVEARDYGNGVWGPQRITSEQFRLNRSTGDVYLQSRTVTTFDAAFAVNAPISESDLRLQLPTGTRVHDELIDEHYIVQ